MGRRWESASSWKLSSKRRLIPLGLIIGVLVGLSICLKASVLRAIAATGPGASSPASTLFAPPSGGSNKEAPPLQSSPGPHQAARPQLPTKDDLRPQPAWIPVIRGRLWAYSAHWDARALGGLSNPYVLVLLYAEGSEQDAKDMHSMGLGCRFLRADGASFNTTGVLRERLQGGTMLELLCGTEGRVGRASDAYHSVQLTCDSGPHHGHANCTTHWAVPISGSEILHHLFSQPQLTQQERASSFVVMPNRSELAVCVRPFMDGFDRPTLLAQFLTYYRLVGASHFTFFGSGNIWPRSSRVLRRAQAAGLSVEVLPWNEANFQPEPWMLNQFGSIQACVLWNMHRFQHVAVVDLDEYLLSHRFMTLPQAVSAVTARRPNAAVFRFQHQIMYVEQDPLQADDDTTVREGQEEHWPPLQVLRVLQRSDEWWAPNPLDRTKTIMNTTHVLVPGAHEAHLLADGAETYLMPLAEGALLHYRRGLKNNVRTKAEERGMLKYAQALQHSPLLAAMLAEDEALLTA